MNHDSRFALKPLSTSEYVLALFEPTDNVAILSRNRRTGRTIQRIATAENIADPQFQSWLQSENAAGSDIFIGMNPLKNGADGRTKENIATIRHLYLDLDTGGQEVLTAIRNSPEVPAPNFVLDASPGKHQVVWTVEGLELQEAESMLRAMAAEFGGDPAATDASRVLRLPGFTNKKSGEEFIIVAHQETTGPYQARDFKLPEDSSGRSRHAVNEARTKTAQGHKSQSEQDWAYAKRALARADDPEEVMRRIANFRAEEKPNPEYYARYTVLKAQAALERKVIPTSETPEPVERGSQKELTPMYQSDEDLLTVREVAEILRVPNSWVYERTRRRSRDRIPGFRLGKYWRFRLGDIKAWVEGNRHGGIAAA